MSEKKIIKKINNLIKDYFKLKKNKFIPGKTRVRYAGASVNEKEVIAAVDSLLSGWFGLGKNGELLEKKLAEFIGTKFALLTNSGSSANLLAISSLMSDLLPGKLNEGDEVITTACSFPTTISPIVQNRLVPVFLDVHPQTYNFRAEDLPKALSKKTRAIFLCHNLGNPNEMDKVMKFAKDNNLFVIEDNCDALGSKYDGKKTGSFGNLSTESFYPAHHITMGEGGAVLINDARFYKIVQSIRDWGRACWCGASGGPSHGNCGSRFKFKINGIPYDHKYIFNHIGYNLKPIDAQAAIGLEQFKKINKFIKKRKDNFRLYYNFFKNYEDFFILPKALPKSDPSWFSFLLTIREAAPFDRHTLVKFLEELNIETRPSFSGNILRQPGYKNIKCRIVEPLKNSDRIFERTFFIGIYPGLGKKQIDYVMWAFKKFFSKY